MDRIPYHEVKFHPHSFGDPDGRLFQWDGQLYRAISHEKAPFFKQLFRNGVIQELVDRGLLIGSELANLVLDGYGMVVRHHCVPFVSYPHEWCPAMFKEAAFTYIKLARELVRRGLILKDTHPWNILFDGCKPVYVDLTSIRTMTGDARYPPYDKFCRYYLYPLVLMSHGKGRIARCLMPEYEGILESDVSMLIPDCSFSASVVSKLRHMKSVLRQQLPEPMAKLVEEALKPIRSLFPKQIPGPNSALDFLEDLRREIENVSLPSFRFEHLDNDRDSTPPWSYRDLWTAKQRGLHEILSELRPGSVLDIGSNTGWYSKLAAFLGSKVVAFDLTPIYITQLYFDARDKNLPILPLIMDFTDPTPSRGLSSHSSIAAAERFRCDMVLALSLVPDVVFKRKLHFDQVVEGLALFSKRWLVVEFAPRKDREVCKLWSSMFSWYTLDNFTNTLKKRFRTVDLMPSYPEPRVLVLCEK